MDIQPFYGRDYRTAKRVDVYRNTRAGTWAIMAIDGPHAGTVVGHAKRLALDVPLFAVNPQGRARELQTRQPVVHAMIRGFITQDQFDLDDRFERAVYHPYKHGYYYLVGHDHMPLPAAVHVVLTEAGQIWVR